MGVQYWLASPCWVVIVQVFFSQEKILKSVRCKDVFVRWGEPFIFVLGINFAFASVCILLDHEVSCIAIEVTEMNYNVLTSSMSFVLK